MILCAITAVYRAPSWPCNDVHELTSESHILC